MSDSSQQGGGPRPPAAGPSDAEVAALLRDAGRRPEPPPADLEALTRVAREAWQDGLARRRAARRPRLLLAAAGVVVLVGAAWWWRSSGLPGPPGKPAIAGRVERWSGAVRLSGRPPARETLSVGAVLTTGAGESRSAFLSVLLASGASLRLDGGSELRLLEPPLVELQKGAVYIDSHGGARGSVEVRTPLGSVRELGTQFEVRLESDRALRVRVREGRVALRRGAHEISAQAGEELAWHRDGEATRLPVDLFGPAWAWAAAAAVAPPIDGRSLAEALRWFSRETGRRLVYADPDLEGQAERIRLRGSVEDLSPEQALDVVLAGSGLGYRLEPGTVHIERPPRAE